MKMTFQEIRITGPCIANQLRDVNTICRRSWYIELEVKETTDTASSASFLDLYLEFDDSGQLSTKIYDKRDDFNFKIINFPNMCSNIPASNVKNILTSHIDKKKFLTSLTSLSLYIFTI
jgi:hypothetical protein